MAYESFPNDAHNGRTITLAEHEQIAVGLGALSGLLFWDGGAPLFADSTGLQVKVPSNTWASIRGTRFNNPETTTVPIGANTSGKTRIDLVVLRLRKQETSLGAGDQYTIVPHVIPGVPGDNPVAPSPVRNTTSGSGYWDIPLAEVTVAHNATSIGSTQLKQRGYWITGSGYTGRESWGFPPVEPGVIFQANDTGKTYIGTNAGSWLTLYDDSGALTLPLSGLFTASRNVLHRRNGATRLAMTVARPGGPLLARTTYTIGTLPAGFRPATSFDFFAVTTAPVIATCVVSSSGDVTIRPTAQINAGDAIVVAPPNWFAA